MHNYEFGSYGGQGHQSAPGDPDGGRPRQHSVFSLVAMIAVIAVIALLALSVAFWVFGLVFHIAGMIFKVAILAAVAALVWRRVTRHRPRHRDGI